MHGFRFWRSLRKWLRARDRLRAETLGAAAISDRGLNQDVATAITDVTVSAATRRIGIEPDRIPNDSLIRNDIVRVCSACSNQTACRKWLVDGTVDTDAYNKFCPNAERFARLLM